MDQPSDVRELVMGVQAQADEPAKRRSRLLERRFWGVALTVVGSAIPLYWLLFELSSHAVSANSDSATVALEGHSMLAGNVLLSGWTISLDSFWSIDAVVNAAAVGFLGLTNDLVNVVPALVAVAVIILGAFISSWGFETKSRIAAAIFVAALLALPSHALSFFFLQGPWHVATALWCLIAFFGIRRGRLDWGWATAVVILGIGLLGDVQILVFGVVSVALAGITAMLRTRSWRRGLPTFLVAPAACVFAVIVREIALRVGTFTFHESHHTAKLVTIEHNAGHLWHWGAALFGVVNGPFGGPKIAPVFSAAHVVGLLVVVGGVVAALCLVLRGVVCGTGHPRSADAAPLRANVEGWRLDDVLLFGIFGDLGAFAVLTLSNNILYARYLTVALIFSVLLAGRMVARLMHHLPSDPPVLAGTALAAVVLIGTFALQVSGELRSPGPAQPIVQLDRFLAAHHLRHGVGDYWAASIVTLESKGEIEVRPVVANLYHQIVPDGRQADSAWYRNESFGFLVYQTLPYGRVDAATVTRTFGAPTHLYRVGRYFVATWSHPLRLSDVPFP